MDIKKRLTMNAKYCLHASAIVRRQHSSSNHCQSIAQIFYFHWVEEAKISVSKTNMLGAQKVYFDYSKDWCYEELVAAKMDGREGGWTERNVILLWSKIRRGGGASPQSRHPTFCDSGFCFMCGYHRLRVTRSCFFEALKFVWETMSITEFIDVWNWLAKIMFLNRFHDSAVHAWMYFVEIYRISCSVVIFTKN